MLFRSARVVLSNVLEPTSKDKGKERSEYHIARTDPSVKSVIDTKGKAREDAGSGMLTFLSNHIGFNSNISKPLSGLEIATITPSDVSYREFRENGFWKVVCRSK